MLDFPWNIIGLVSNLNIPGVPIPGNESVLFIPIVFKAIKITTKQTTRMQVIDAITVVMEFPSKQWLKKFYNHPITTFFIFDIMKLMIVCF